ADSEQVVERGDDAIRSYERVVKLDPLNNEAWHDLGCSLVEAGRLDNALDAFRRSLEINPEWGEPYFELAKLYFLKEEANLGLLMLDEAFKRNPHERFDFDFNNDWKIVLNFLAKRQPVYS
ncbi:MAG: tetratricopeptide repeat protein, partial [Ignavibacteria bacterium]